MKNRVCILVSIVLLVAACIMPLAAAPDDEECCKCLAAGCCEDDFIACHNSLVQIDIEVDDLRDCVKADPCYAANYVKTMVALGEAYHDLADDAVSDGNDAWGDAVTDIGNSEWGDCVEDVDEAKDFFNAAFWDYDSARAHYRAAALYSTCDGCDDENTAAEDELDEYIPPEEDCPPGPCPMTPPWSGL